MPVSSLPIESAKVTDPDRKALIALVLERKEAVVTSSGALSAWHPAHSTGRIPKDTYIVRRTESEASLDWKSPACLPMEERVFDMLLSDALAALQSKGEHIVLHRSAGHDPRYALPLTIVTDSALTALFADNIFCRSVSGSTGLTMTRSVLHSEPFTVAVVPNEAIDREKYRGLLREENGRVVAQAIAMDFDRRIAVVYGTRYCGAVKKTVFTAMNYYLPQEGVLPLHCSCNEGEDGASALFLGLSGTGKTTLSSDPRRTLIGDDEHGWTGEGIFNMEGGCYAKLIRLREEKEPGIFRAVFTPRKTQENGCIIENAMTYPDGSIDVDDDRLTENSRVSYPLSFLRGSKHPAVSGHPSTVIFLTADAKGVLPPVAKLGRSQAMLWFLLGYTSKLAGTESGVIEPKSTFSRFFGGPFMPRHPRDYVDLFGQKYDEHQLSVYLVNTGWTGGPYGTGQRMDITLTRKLVDAALDGSLKTTSYREDQRWKFDIPVSVPGIDADLLDPRRTWKHPEAFDRAADALALEFAAAFAKSFSDTDPAIRSVCPGL